MAAIWYLRNKLKHPPSPPTLFLAPTYAIFSSHQRALGTALSQEEEKEKEKEGEEKGKEEDPATLIFLQ